MNKININDFNYDLPEERIAKFPLEKRDSSKLLIYKQGEISEKNFYNLPEFINSGSLLVFNNTKVVHARIIFHKKTGAQIEVFCLEPNKPSNYEQNFAATGSCIWNCVVGNLKKWKDEILVKNFCSGNIEDSLSVEKLSNDGNSLKLKFSWNSQLSFAQVMDACGKMPIPPYLKRESQEIDAERYQTI
jgi:S-adenosylmethionine:tRNA ribosyltransferase-isomerase